MNPIIFVQGKPEHYVSIRKQTTTQPVEPETYPDNDAYFDIEGNHLDFRHGARVRNLVPWFVSTTDEEQWDNVIREKSLFVDELGTGMKVEGERKYFFKFTSGENNNLENVTNDSEAAIMSQNLEFREGASVKGLVFNFVSINEPAEFAALANMSFFYDEKGIGYKYHTTRKYFSIEK